MLLMKQIEEAEGLVEKGFEKIIKNITKMLYADDFRVIIVLKNKKVGGKYVYKGYRYRFRNS